MWEIISSIISGVISPITNTITAIYTKKEDVSLEKFKVDGKVDINLIAADAQITLAKIDLLKNRWIVALQVFLAIPVAVFFWKCVIWDTVLGLGYTPPLNGDVQTWSLMIMAFLFAHSVLDSWSRKT